MYSDNEALRAAFQKNDIHGLLSRWLSLRAEYELEIRHLLGRNNAVANYDSRNTDSFMDEKGDVERANSNRFFNHGLSHAAEKVTRSEQLLIIDKKF